MKKLIMFAAMLAAVGMVAGCFTSATAYTETKHADGSVTVSKVKVLGTGDKASQIASEGLFADGTAEDLGAGVKTASASQTSTGIDGTLAGLGTVLQGMAQFMAASQGAVIAGNGTQGASVASEAGQAQSISAIVRGTPGGETVHSAERFTGSPGPAGEGVYGRASCARCQAYAAAHPEAQLIDLDSGANRADMWAALRLRGYAGQSVSLPVSITADGYTQAAR